MVGDGLCFGNHMMSMLKVPSRFFHTGTVKEAGYCCYAMPRRTQASESTFPQGSVQRRDGRAAGTHSFVDC